MIEKFAIYDKRTHQLVRVNEEWIWIPDMDELYYPKKIKKPSLFDTKQEAENEIERYLNEDDPDNKDEYEFQVIKIEIEENPTYYISRDSFNGV